jgi:hypothetical protein
VQYQYCERYTIAFKDHEYGEMVLHAPPFNILGIILIPVSFIPDPETKKKLSMVFSKMVFWLENIIFVFFFMMFELLLMPILYIKCLFNIAITTRGMFTTVFNIFVWITLGFMFLFLILFMDTWALLRILSMHNGCKENELIKK